MLREQAQAGRVVDPELRKKGVAKAKQPGGRPKAKARGYEKTHRPLGAPILRRDPTAPEKLEVIRLWQERAKLEGVAHPRELPTRLKRELEATWHWKYETVFKWIEVKTALEGLVARLRLGTRGLRPFGSTRALREISGNQGSRLRVNVPGVATKQRPLEAVMHRVHQWFCKEREHRHEVREKTILTRLKFELEYERDKQIVLRDHESEEFLPWSLEVCQSRRASFQINQQTKLQRDWFDKIVCPRIQATARRGQTLHESVDREKMDDKHLVTWATSDRFLHLACRGEVEELRVRVSRPEEFIENRKKTSIVIVDATALWLKLRGEERVFVGEKERSNEAERRRLGKAFRKLNKADPEAVQAFEALKTAYHATSRRTPRWSRPHFRVQATSID